MTRDESTFGTCANCHDYLRLELDNYSDDESGEQSSTRPVIAVPDDAELACGCHFCWQCITEQYNGQPICPHCGSDIGSTSPSGTPQILCNLNNEGGKQDNLDILPLLAEELYLRNNPRDRRCRMFVEFCRGGDLEAIVDLLRSTDDSRAEAERDNDDDALALIRPADEVLRWQDPLADMQSGLHAAVAASSREVAYLLLLLASNYPELSLPALVFQEAASLGVMRSDQTGKVDIRSLRDSHGRTAEDLAREIGGVWHGWVGTGQLAI